MNISKCFRGFLQLRDNESRVYFIGEKENWTNKENDKKEVNSFLFNTTSLAQTILVKVKTLAKLVP